MEGGGGAGADGAAKKWARIIMFTAFTWYLYILSSRSCPGTQVFKINNCSTLLYTTKGTCHNLDYHQGFEATSIHI